MNDLKQVHLHKCLMVFFSRNVESTHKLKCFPRQNCKFIALSFFSYDPKKSRFVQINHNINKINMIKLKVHNQYCTVA